MVLIAFTAVGSHETTHKGFILKISKKMNFMIKVVLTSE